MIVVAAVTRPEHAAKDVGTLAERCGEAREEARVDRVSAVGLGASFAYPRFGSKAPLPYGQRPYTPQKSIDTVGTVDGIVHPNTSPYSSDTPVSLLGMFAAMFLLGSYLLLRGSFSSSRNQAEMKSMMKAMLDEWEERDRKRSNYL